MRIILRAVMVLLASGLIFLAVFAYRFGIDHNPDWGTSRILMALAGGFLLAGVVVEWRWLAWAPMRQSIGARVSHAERQANAWVEGWTVVRLARKVNNWVTNLPGIRWLAQSPERRGALAAILGVLALWLAYTWYMTAGTLTQWFPYFHDYFDRLAQAFLHGQLALLEQPDPALLALSNPYAYSARTGISYPWDVSLFQGKFYLYWGPVPALIAAAEWLVAQVRVEDQALVLAAQCGVGAFLAANLYLMRREFAPRSNPLGLLLLILAGGANLYLLWPSGRPGVYEASILFGQVFLLAGLVAQFFAWKAATHPAVFGLAAGVCFALAAGSRATLVVSVAWLAAFALWQTWRSTHSTGKEKIRFSVWFGLPLILGGAALLWYNYARFGSWIETGLSYQLSIPQYPPERAWLFSLKYLPANLYGYLLRAPLFEGRFPFVSVPFVRETDWPWFIRLPEHYIYHEPQAGLLEVLPLVVLALLPMYRAVRVIFRRSSLPEPTEPALSTALAGAALLQAGVILVYFFSALRFQMEMFPLIYLLACLGIWQVDRSLANHPGWRRLFWLVVMACSLYSLGLGLLGGFSAGDQRFEANNPHLYAALRNWFDAVFR